MASECIRYRAIDREKMCKHCGWDEDERGVRAKLVKEDKFYKLPNGLYAIRVKTHDELPKAPESV